MESVVEICDGLVNEEFEYILWGVFIEMETIFNHLILVIVDSSDEF
jgi:hypothetical protein